MWVFAILVVLVLAGIAMVAAGRGEPLAEVHDDRPDTALGGDRLPERPLRASDVRRIRFPLALRGYRMAEVDALLERLADQLGDEPDPGAPGAQGAGPDRP